MCIEKFLFINFNFVCFSALFEQYSNIMEQFIEELEDESNEILNTSGALLESIVVPEHVSSFYNLNSFCF